MYIITFNNPFKNRNEYTWHTKITYAYIKSYISVTIHLNQLILYLVLFFGISESPWNLNKSFFNMAKLINY